MSTIATISGYLAQFVPISVFLIAIILLADFAESDQQFLLNFLEVTIWPLTLITCAFAFRKVLTYLFFSMEEFNFFGAKGRLRNVQEMIQHKAREMKDKENERDAIKMEIMSLTNDTQSKAQLIKRAVNIAEKIQQHNHELIRERNAIVAAQKREKERFEEMINDLLRQISNLQKQLFEVQKSNFD